MTGKTQSWWSSWNRRLRSDCDRRGVTLIELLLVVAIIAILSAVALPNFLLLQERAQIASGAANLHTIATALNTYYIDYGTLPPGDREAGPFMSHTVEFTDVGNGPAAGGSWDGLPWILYELKYLSEWKTMFCPKYLRLYQGGDTIRGGHPRFHNFRYAYNSSALSTGGHAGGSGIMSGEEWLVRDLYLPPQSGWHGQQYPNYPADYNFPWGDGEFNDQLEQAIYSDFAVRMMIGGTDEQK